MFPRLDFALESVYDGLRMLSFRPLAAQFLGVAAAAFLLIAPDLRAHDTLSFDPNAKPEFAMNANSVIGAPAAPALIHGLVSARLRPDNLEIDLTVADGAAYKLLDPDPYQPSIIAGASSLTGSENFSSAPSVADPHFEQDKPPLTRRAESLFIVTSNGAKLTPLATAVRLTETHDVVFHLTYPHPQPGSLHLALTYFNQVPEGQKVLLTVLNAADKTIASASVGATAPYLDVDLPGPLAATLPSTTPLAGKSGNFPLILMGVGAGLAALFWGLKFIRRPARS